MIYSIRLILLLIISLNVNANDNKTSQILFKINNKYFTNVDLENRVEYVKLINNFKSSILSEKENKEILDDYISSLIFYEYYIQNKIFFKNLNNEIDLIYKKNLIDNKKLNETQVENFKFNTNIDLIRNKIIEEKLNLKKDTLLQEVKKNDLLYNYNLKYIIIDNKLINAELLKNINNGNDFNDLYEYLKKNNINFFFKEEDINDNGIISNKIKKIIDLNQPVYAYNENGYISLISINKNLESYEGIYVKLINFKTNKPLKKKDLLCENLNKTIDNNKTIFKEYEYSKLNNKIKNNLKSMNDHILIKEKDDYNYIILCDLTYDEKLLKNINFNKNVNSLVNKIQRNFLKKYKYEYKFVKIK